MLYVRRSMKRQSWKSWRTDRVQSFKGVQAMGTLATVNRHTDEGTNGLMIIWAGLFVAGQFGDLATTWWGMHLGLSEMNPAAILVGQERLYLIKIGVIALVPIIAFLAKGISRLLLDWYATHGRDLPWRRDSGWYAVWISEVMLQQTRVETVRRYYERWIEKFPTVEALAAVELDKVLAFWEGLGYYRRAHFLHQAARILVAEHGGRLPRTVVELRRLPGIGRYTAAAIASIAFGADELALDGNHRRVLSRLFDL